MEWESPPRTFRGCSRDMSGSSRPATRSAERVWAWSLRVRSWRCMAAASGQRASWARALSSTSPSRSGRSRRQGLTELLRPRTGRCLARRSLASASAVTRARVPGLIDPELAAPRKCDEDEPAPTLVVGWQPDVDLSCDQLLDRRVEVTAHHVQLVAFLLARVDGDLCRRQGEDQPPATRVDPVQAEDIAKELAVRLRVRAPDDHVRAGEQRTHALRSRHRCGLTDGLWASGSAGPVTFHHLAAMMLSATRSGWSRSAADGHARRPEARLRHGAQQTGGPSIGSASPRSTVEADRPSIPVTLATPVLPVD